MPSSTTTTTTKNLEKSSRPHILKVWFVACRPHTLTASLAPLVVGYNASLANITFRDENNNDLNDVNDKSKFISISIQWTIFCMMMQLGCNLHNDYADFIKGADTEKRVGQARATQRGWLTPNQTATASCMFLFIGLLLGLNFLRHIHNGGGGGGGGGGNTAATTTTTTTTTNNMGIMIFIIVTSIFNAFAYTGGWPLNYIGLGNFSIGYSGLGDLFVFLYFGLVATLTLPFIYISSSSSPYTNTATGNNNNHEDNNLGMVLWNIFPYAIQVAVLGVNIIVVNNLRDRFTDVSANKRTLAVRFGPAFCRLEYLCNLVIAYSFVAYDWWLRLVSEDGNGFDYNSLARLLPFLSLPLAMKELRCIQTKDGGALNSHVGGAAKVQFLFCILLGISLRIS